MAFGKKVTVIDVFKDIDHSTQLYKIGDYLIAKELVGTVEGTVDAIEWSTSFSTWCYRLVGKNPPYWVYQTNRTLSGKGYRRPPPLPPSPLPDPISIME